jgi:hypothetical protein
MGFWQGLNEGLTYVMEDAARKKELEAARQERTAERQANIDIEEARYQRSRTDAASDRLEANKQRLQEIYLPLAVEAAQKDKEARAISSKAQELLDILGDSKDPKVTAMRNNPQMTAGIMDTLLKRQEEAAADGRTLSFDRQTLLANIHITGSGEAVPIEPMNALVDITDFSSLTTAIANLPTYKPTAEGRVEAAYGFNPDAKNLDEGRRVFETNMFTLAGQQRDALLKEPQTDTTGEKQKAWSSLNNIIETASKGDAAAVATLKDMYGQQAFETVVATDNRYTAAIVDTPEFAPFAQNLDPVRVDLVKVLSDPTATETDRAMARDKLTQLGWAF